MNDEVFRLCKRCYQVVAYSNSKSGYPLPHKCPHGQECTRVPIEDASVPTVKDKQHSAGCVRCLIEIHEALDDKKPFKRSYDKY